MAGQLSGKAVAVTAAGFVLLWSGIKNATLKDTLTSLLKGQNPPATPEAAPVAGVSPAAATTSAGGTPAGTNAAEAPATLNANQALGKLMAAGLYGWTGAQWNALYALWTRESGWNNTADNPSSGAYGIAQALGHGTGGAPYPASSGAANPPQYGGSSSATAQIAWGLAYIKSTYGSPEAAWAHEESAGWY